MRFENEVRDQYLTYSDLGNRVATKLSLFSKQSYLPELRDLLGTSEYKNTESLGVIEIPVNKIVGIASICGKYSYTVDFLPVMPPHSRFADTWCNIYLDYLNEKKISPILCYEYLGNFYVIDGKTRVSVMKCHGVPTMAAKVIRILPTDKDSAESIQYYSFLESYRKTGLYQVCLCSKYTFDDLQRAMGHDKDYQWTEDDRRFILFALISVKYGLKLSKLNDLAINPIDAFMVLVDNFGYAAAIKMSSLQMAKFFKANKEKLLTLCHPVQKKVKRIA